MRSNHAEGNVALFEQPDKKRTRHTKNVRRAFGGEFLMLRHNGNSLISLKIFQDRKQQLLNYGRQFDLMSIRTDKFCSTGFDQSPKFRYRLRRSSGNRNGLVIR